MGLVLASTSPYRRQLLDRLGLPFEQRSPRFDESLLSGMAHPRPAELARRLATEKVNSLVPECPRETIIGGDQVVEVDGRVLSKPGTAERALNQLSELSGRSHRIATAVAVWHEGRLITHVDMTTLTMRALDRDALSRYVEADMPLDCSGSYKLESRGVALFDRIETADYTAIIGMPLIALTSILRSVGFSIP